MTGRDVTGGDVAPRAGPPFERLTPRQRDCLRGLAALKSAKAIGNELGIAESTVYGHLDGATKVLGLADRAAAALALRDHEAGGGTAHGAGTDPRKPTEQSPRVAAEEASGAAERRPTASGSLRLPFRAQGARFNDLSPLERLAWIPALAILLAIGFGMLGAGLHFVSGLVVAVFHR